MRRRLLRIAMRSTRSGRIATWLLTHELSLRARVLGFIAILLVLSYPASKVHSPWPLIAGCVAYLALVLPAIRR